MTVPKAPVPQGGPADVVYVVCLMQAAFVLLAGLGEMLLMGFNPLYLVMPTAKMVLLFVFAAKVVSGRRWAMIALIVVEAVTLVGFWIQAAAGLLPWVDFTVNIVVLLTNIGLPTAVVYLCASMFARTRRARPPRLPIPAGPMPARPVIVYAPALPARALAPPQDPFAPAPLVTTVVLPNEVGR